MNGVPPATPTPLASPRAILELIDAWDRLDEVARADTRSPAELEAWNRLARALDELETGWLAYRKLYT